MYLLQEEPAIKGGQNLSNSNYENEL